MEYFKYYQGGTLLLFIIYFRETIDRFPLVDMMVGELYTIYEYFGYNCRITTYDLMKDSISIGKIDTKNSDWLVFDENAIENNPKELLNQADHQKF